MAFIYRIFKEYKYSLILIYLYALGGQMVFLFEPYILGKMIDGLLIKEYGWVAIFLLMEMFANALIYKRMTYDTKVYTSIYNNLIFKYLKREDGQDSSTKIARTEMANNIINFLENDAQYFITSIISIIGTIFFIFMGDAQTGLVVSLSVIPIVVIVRTFMYKISQSTKVGNDHYEQKVQTLSYGDYGSIKTFFKRRRRILIFGSTLQGKNWVSLNVSKIVFLILALIVFTNDNMNLSQGQAVSMYSYINQFLISLMSIPIAMETFTRIKDVVNRIRES